MENRGCSTRKARKEGVLGGSMEISGKGCEQSEVNSERCVLDRVIARSLVILGKAILLE